MPVFSIRSSQSPKTDFYPSAKEYVFRGQGQVAVLTKYCFTTPDTNTSLRRFLLGFEQELIIVLGDPQPLHDRRRSAVVSDEVFLSHPNLVKIKNDDAADERAHRHQQRFGF